MKLIPRKKFERTGESQEQCLWLNYLHWSLLHLHMLWKLKKLKKWKKIPIGLSLYQLLNPSLCHTEDPLRMLSACYMDENLLFLTNLSTINNLQSIMHWVALFWRGHSIWHNEVRNITTHQLSDIYHNIRIEPQLQSMVNPWPWRTADKWSLDET